MDTINYTFVADDSQVRSVVVGLTYSCCHCNALNLIHKKEDVYGMVVKEEPDSYTMDLIFGHECTHCRTEVTISHHLQRAFRVWMNTEEEENE